MSAKRLHLAFASLLCGLIPAPAATLYVDVNSTNPVPPYTNWATAANLIQDAVDAAADGDTVLVTNGVYATGGRAIHGTMTNRVAVDRAIQLESVMGPELTMIEGKGPLGASAIRCVYLTNGASLVGFTLTNGATLTVGDFTLHRSGAGLFCDSTNAWITNCVVTSNTAESDGGGAFRGSLYSCTLTNNKAAPGGNRSYGSGAAFSTLQDCLVVNSYGTGVRFCTLVDCLLSGNYRGAIDSRLDKCTLTGNTPGSGAIDSTLYGCLVSSNYNRAGGGLITCSATGCVIIRNTSGTLGAVWGGTLTNCVVAGNVSDGASWATLDNCVVVGNSGDGVVGGGDVYNSVVYHNGVSSGQNHVGGTFYDSCTTPMPTTGLGNITNAPLFVSTNDWADLRLQSNSPCINAGNNAYVTSTNDLDSNPRIAGGTVDMGAYEFQSPQSAISYAWLQQYGLPTDGSVDDIDADGDRATTWQEWKAWTIPTNALSVLSMLHPTATTNGTEVSWQSVVGHSYNLERASNGAANFNPLQSGIAGQANITSFTDTTATNGESFLYLVGVPE